MSSPPQPSTPTNLDSEEIVQVPKNLISPAAIEYTGFNPLTARIIWTRWLSMSDPLEELFSFLNFLLECIISVDADATHGRENYRRAFMLYGLETTLIDGLVDEEFDDLMHTQSSATWA